MRAIPALSAAAVCALALATVSAQQKPDPRVGLKPGLHDAGEAAWNLERVVNLPKPEGFFDPKAPAGNPAPPERDPNAPPDPNNPPRDPNVPPPFDPVASNRLGFTNSDLAFSGNHAFVGNYHGFNTYDVERPTRPKLLASIVCPGGQGDVSVHGNLLFMSVEQTRGRLDCGVQGVPTPVSTERFRGIRIFDISDLAKPKQVAAIQTCRGSHTHTLVPDAKDPANLYVYGSGTSSVRAGEELTGCSGAKPDEDPNTALFSIDVIKVPLAHPEQAAIVNKPRIFADPATGKLNGLWNGGDHGEGTQKTSVTNQCHDITVFPEIGLAAGACSGNGILLDIHDPVHPARLDDVSDKNFAYWHSATFNNDGTKVLFSDEWGGGGQPKCRVTDKHEWGADALFTIEGDKLKFHSYYKMPAPQTRFENCVAHNGSLVPIPGRDVMIQSWYQGGISLFDWTDIDHPREIAFFDRGPVDSTRMASGGTWSVYWYNGVMVSSEISRGLDIVELTPSAFISQNEIDAAKSVKWDYLNTQGQRKIVWPPSFALSGAYLDQLERSHGLAADKIAADRAALRSAEKASGSDRSAALTKLAAQIDADASGSSDNAKMQKLSESVKALAGAQ